MFAPPILSHPVEQGRHQGGVLTSERTFYESYDWCLNPYLTMSEAVGHLRKEIDKLVIVSQAWQVNEIATNTFLLSCGLLNCVEEYLRGSTLRLTKRLSKITVARAAARSVEIISTKPWSRGRVARWREQWISALDYFLLAFVASQPIDGKRLFDSCNKLLRLLRAELPADLLTNRLNTPSPFSHLDLAASDILKLGAFFIRRFPDRTQPILILGLRTSGSYIAPLLRAFLVAEGYGSVAFLTINPKKGTGRKENKNLRQFAKRGCLVLIVDDPPRSSRTLLDAIQVCCQVGFSNDKIKLLAPTQAADPSWSKNFPKDSVITLEPEQWYKAGLLNLKTVELRLAEYFRGKKFSDISVTASRPAEGSVGCHAASDRRGVRLKRIFEVKLATPAGEAQTTYVMAKSVGCGWFSYRAFLIAHRLSGHVPPILGLRDGILYTEWIPQQPTQACSKEKLLKASASYVAARVRHLKLKIDPQSALDLKQHNNGSRLLAKVLSRAYGRYIPDALMRPRLDYLVRAAQCPCPTLIDGNMHGDEWIFDQHKLLKTDYEHHGMGKSGINVIDPAFDLADTILKLKLTPEEEDALIRKYTAASGDSTVKQRLYMYKLLAGLWSMSHAQAQLFDSPCGGDLQRSYHRSFMSAWNFLTVQTARHCGSLCYRPADLRWSAPLVLLDIDGVLDRRLFGFPCTTVAGMTALSLLASHQISVALNTTRSLAEVKEYCAAYSLAGGVAEHGSCIWDAVRQREQVLISAETEHQLATLKKSLQQVPGVFFDERHQYSIRAFTYRDKPTALIQSLAQAGRASSIGDGALGPISTHVVHQLLTDLRLDRLTFHHTLIDTKIVAREVDKGTGLAALQNRLLTPDSETIAVGDDKPDLAMFRAATRSFAPANIGCRTQAQLLGCKIATHPYQQGLLEIVRALIPKKNGKEQGSRSDASLHDSDELFFSVLSAADQTWRSNLLKALLDPISYRIFIH
jgi:hydroxymethylpyrimidine pyrophosphatase-like HAD family hydrolase